MHQKRNHPQAGARGRFEFSRPAAKQVLSREELIANVTFVKAAPEQPDLFGTQQPRLLVNAAEIGRHHCRRCSGESWILRPGRGPHAAGIECVSCGKHEWLPKDDAEDLLRRAAS